MPVGISINIGVNAPAGLDCCSRDKLEGAEGDARFMAELASKNGFQTQLLLGSDGTATLANVEKAVTGAQSLQQGGYLLLTFSGHGCQVPDLNRDEVDKQDETWCLHDQMLLDDQLYHWFSGFNQGVRIVVISVSCNSGGIVVLNDRDKQPAASPSATLDSVPLPTGGAGVLVPDLRPEGNLSLERNQEIQGSFPLGRNVDIKASGLVLTACEKDKNAEDGKSLTLYTSVLKEVWADGTFKGTYQEFHGLIVAGVTKRNQLQIPQIFPIGRPPHTLISEQPFRI